MWLSLLPSTYLYSAIGHNSLHISSIVIFAILGSWSTHTTVYPYLFVQVLLKELFLFSNFKNIFLARDVQSYVARKFGNMKLTDAINTQMLDNYLRIKRITVQCGHRTYDTLRLGGEVTILTPTPHMQSPSKCPCTAIICLVLVRCT